MTPVKRATAVALAALAFALSPLLAGGFGGFDPQSFPVPQVDPPAQPAGWAFGIWGLIYAWLLVHGGFGVFRRMTAEDWDRTRPPLLVALVIGAAWIPVARASPLWATVLIALMLGGAVAALLTAPRRDPWFAEVPLGLFAGWLTAATCVSLGLLAGGYGIVSNTTAGWMALLLAFGAAVAVLLLRPSWGYAAAAGWALIGIAATNLADQPSLALASCAGAVALAGLAIRRRRRSS